MKKKAKSIMPIAIMIPIIVLDILFRGEKSNSTRVVF
ncbi:MAG: hypothetical protein APG12_00275 [Candidatus Methanofastidiosum methylothiophilum]|uniref:Uncharacterized protein n=1 Tax=Candidatus Methanofastidiosum methylothiophilum TaxID=1705564 RepID=A0A150ILV8_9EURY|nr:MAG: hypothetical protein APG10_00309 [Candidatus Methanofastidiosum methylthiophilus]KYC48646.1 MAG: hypothetical protein APG11_00156 [Candidatus Methanofastidiosum methylthiophilus]KYC51149.1 MAG: hypothetical protein APG12_00275 [Candidatus Methanofastidiosum methylthiophilus]